MIEKDILGIVRDICGEATPEKPVELHSPYLPENTKKYVLECFDSGKLSAGIKVKKGFEILFRFGTE